jgi:phosphoribosylaminoimidazolecarboxamide formyltransferase/IMP cyclohydrolase
MASAHLFAPDQKIAFISVFDKTGLEPVARALVENYNYQLLSTGGTKKFLEEKGIPVIETSQITGFDELLGGRVKSLHPEIFAGILAERDKIKNGEVPFLIDTVIVNLYPFEQESQSEKAKDDPYHALHFIDIGGPSLIRSAAKNYPFVNVLCNPDQYSAFLNELKFGNGESSLAFRKKLAYQAFQRTLGYEAAITQYFGGDLSVPGELSEQITLSLQKIQDMRYGENPHQKAALYGLGKNTVDFELLHGKALSYNNILDMEAAWSLVTEFNDTIACAIIKHNTPCGVAISDKSVADAYHTAFDADPLSAFGGVVAVNEPITEKAAKEMKEVFLEVIIAPDFEPAALDLLQTKKNLRLVKRPLPSPNQQAGLQFKQVSPELFLVQTDDQNQEHRIERLFENRQIQVVTDKKPTEAQLRDMIFAWKVVKHVKSNAIVLAKDGKTIGICGGQTSRIGALEKAIEQACDEAKDAVLASDGFFPAVDNIHAAVQARVGAIIQPGGSIKDSDVISTANQYELPMVTTGVREFKH